MIKAECFICDATDVVIKENYVNKLTQYSKTPIIKFIYEKLHYDFSKEESAEICYSCLEDVNTLDLYATERRSIRDTLLKKIKSSTENVSFKNSPLKIEKEFSEKKQSKEVTEDEFSVDQIILDDKEEIPDTTEKKDEKQINENLTDKVTNVIEDEIREQKITKVRIRRKKKEVPTSVECPKCQKCYRTKKLLGQHLRLSHAPQRFPCNICGASLKSKVTLHNHSKMHLESPAFQCKICGKSYIQSRKLSDHMAVHTGKMNYQCDECGKQFRVESTFKYHKASHSGIRKHKCNVCGLGMITADQLKRHMMTHTGEKPYTCPVCNQKFANSFNMKVHHKLHEGIKYVRRKHQCTICSKEFPRKIKLNEHLELAHQTVVNAETVEVKE